MKAFPQAFVSGPPAIALAIAAALVGLLLTTPLEAQRRKRTKKEVVPFAVSQTDILDSQDGYPVPLDSAFFPGETVHVRFLVDGYTRGPYDRIWLTWRVESFGPLGDRLAMAETGGVDTEVAPQDRDWKPIIRYSPTIPPHAGGGEYRVAVHVTDRLNDVTVSKELPIQVRADSVRSGDELTVRSFTISKTEGGPAYREKLFEPGDTVWGQFFITGYKLSDENAYDVHAGLQFLDAEGKVLFDFKPQEQEDASFYPRRWLPAVFQLTLDENLLPGTYQIALKLDDRLGKQTYTAMQSFRVE